MIVSVGAAAQGPCVYTTKAAPLLDAPMQSAASVVTLAAGTLLYPDTSGQLRNGYLRVALDEQPHDARIGWVDIAAIELTRHDFICATETQLDDFIVPVPSIPFHGDGNSVLVRGLGYAIGDTHDSVTVPAGFVTDYASVPRPLWLIFPPQGEWLWASVVHDYLYWDQTCTREQADNIFRMAMREEGVANWAANALYAAVRLFGGKARNANQAERAAGRPRILPKRYRTIRPLTTWAAYRDTLYRQRVRDDKSPRVRQAVCRHGNSPKKVTVSRTFVDQALEFYRKSVKAPVSGMR
jgi:hypothetical protein